MWRLITICFIVYSGIAQETRSTRAFRTLLDQTLSTRSQISNAIAVIPNAVPVPPARKVIQIFAKGTCQSMTVRIPRRYVYHVQVRRQSFTLLQLIDFILFFTSCNIFNYKSKIVEQKKQHVRTFASSSGIRRVSPATTIWLPGAQVSTWTAISQDASSTSAWTVDTNICHDFEWTIQIEFTFQINYFIQTRGSKNVKNLFPQ